MTKVNVVVGVGNTDTDRQEDGDYIMLLTTLSSNVPR